MYRRFVALICAGCLFVAVVVPAFDARPAIADSSPPVAQTLSYSAEQWAGLPQLVAQWAWYQAVLEAEWYDNVNARMGDHGAIGRVIDRVFGPAAPWFRGIVQRESGFDPRAVNRSSGACGLGQLLGHEDILVAVGYPGGCLDPIGNILASYSLFSGSGTAPWRLG